jgi:acyl-CoA thioester hydrolase
VAVRSRLLDRSEKRLHYMHFMVNETTGALAATQEAMGTHADLTRRRSAPWPPDITANLDALIAEHNVLPWEAPLSGAVQL